MNQDKNKNPKKFIMPLWTDILVFSVVGLVLCRVGGVLTRTPQLVLLAGVLLLAALIAFLGEVLRRSVAVTLYSYQNIGLVGGMLFVAVFALVLLVNFCACFRTEDISMRDVFLCVLQFPHQFSVYAAAVIVAVCLALGVSNVALIRHEGFCLNNALSLLVAALYLGGTQAIYFINDFLEKRVFAAAGAVGTVLGTVIPLFLLLVLSYFECVLAGSAVMGWVAARAVPRYDKDFIVILGCSIDKRGGLLPLLKGRVNRAVRFAWEQEIAGGHPLRYVPSGGQGANEVISEGSAMELYLLAHGAEEYEVLPEKKSVNTLENFAFSKKIIDAEMPDARVAFATTNYHILRSGILARMVGLDAEGIAGDTKWYFWPNGFVREFFGILSLEIRTHIAVTALLAVLCVGIGVVSYFVLV